MLLKGEPLRNLSARHDKCIHDFVDEMIKDFEQVSQLYNIVEMYVGEFAGNEKHGFGRECKKEGWYSGQFSNGLKHGIGT